MLYIQESEVQKLLSMPACVDMMRKAFEELKQGTAKNQPRRRLILPTGSVLHQMTGSFGAYFATKIYSSNLKHGGLHQVYVLLYSAETGKAVAMIEANALGEIRTGAATGYATDLLAAKDASILGVIGTGTQARTQIDAVRAVRDIKETRVWSRKPENVERFAKETNSIAASTAEAAVRGAHIVVTITSAKDPVLESSWLSLGTFVAGAGNNIANRRELPTDLMQSAALVAVDNLEQAKIESGDLLIAYGGTEGWKNVVELKDVPKGHHADGITIFESQGIGVEDAAAGSYVYEQALQQGIGREMP